MAGAETRRVHRARGGGGGACNAPLPCFRLQTLTGVPITTAAAAHWPLARIHTTAAANARVLQVTPVMDSPAQVRFDCHSVQQQQQQEVARVDR